MILKFPRDQICCQQSTCMPRSYWKRSSRCNMLLVRDGNSNIQTITYAGGFVTCYVSQLYSYWNQFTRCGLESFSMLRFHFMNIWWSLYACVDDLFAVLFTNDVYRTKSWLMNYFLFSFFFVFWERTNELLG